MVPIPVTGESEDRPFATPVREVEAVVQIGGCVFLNPTGSGAAGPHKSKLPARYPLRAQTGRSCLERMSFN